MKEVATQTKAPELSPLETRSPQRSWSKSAVNHPFVRLQRTIGNQATQRLVQTKAVSGESGDVYEQEADRVAEKVVRMPAPAREWNSAPQSGSIRPRTSGNALPDLDAGQPLDLSTRAFFEPRFGTDFADVRVHADNRVNELPAQLNARAFTTGSNIVFGRGEFAPQTPVGEELLAHELTHVVQQRGFRQPAVQCAPAPQRPIQGTQKSRVAGDPPQKRLHINAERLRTDAVPAFQRALDLVDPILVQGAGDLVLALWTGVAAGNEALRPPEGIRAPDAPELPEFVEIRDTVLSGVTIQQFRGEDLLGRRRKIEHVADVGRHIVAQTEAAVATVRDAKEFTVQLRRRVLTVDEERTAISYFANHPNPWQFAYMLAVVKGEGLDNALKEFGLAGHTDFAAVLASQEFLKKRHTIGPADRIGIAEPLPKDRKVRLLRPYGGRELALEVYGTSSFYETLLVPYNRSALENLSPAALIPAGTEILIEPQLTHGRYRMVFMAVEMTKRQADRPFIDASPPGAAIVNTKSRYTLRWPIVEPPNDAWTTSTGELLWKPLSKLVEWVDLEWSVENDPSVVGRKYAYLKPAGGFASLFTSIPLPTVHTSEVPAEEWIKNEEATTETLNKDGVSIDHHWFALGTNTVRCKVTFHGAWGLEPTELRYPQPVVTEREKLEADWPTVDDPRIDPSLVFAERAETYGEFQRIVEQLGITEDELAHNPGLASGVRTSYYPEFLLRDLRQQLAATDNEKRRSKLQYQIESIEKAIEQSKSWGLRQVRAMYVSGDEKQTISIPLNLYIAPDPEAPAAFPFALKLWDFTLEGTGRGYTDGHGAWTPEMAVHGLFDQYGDEAPYQKGVVRIVIESSLLPKEFAGEYALAREIYEVHTHGGLLIVKVAGGLIMLGALTVGVFTLGATVALTAFAIYGAVTSLVNIIERLEAGTFEWDVQTGMDILGIVGGLTAVASPVISVVRGVGAVAWLGTTARLAGVLQMGVMVGHHLTAVAAAIESGDNDKILEAVTAAVIDGAIVVVTHKAGAEPERPGNQAGRGAIGEGTTPRISLPTIEAERPSTAVGIGGERPPGPPGQEPAPKAGAAQATQEAWTAQVAEKGLSPRPGPGQPAGPPVGPGNYETVAGQRTFSTPEPAFAAYDEALTRAGGREVGVFRNAASPTGEYVVRIGDQHSVSGPGGGNWESVLHKHPNPENVLTRRMPAPQDVQNTLHAAFRSGRPVTEFIDYPMPDGRHGLVAYTVEPVKGEVTIKYETTDGKTVERKFSSIEAYASHYGERTTYVDPTSPEYRWMIQDLHDFYADRPYSGGATATGVLKPGPPEVEGPIEKPEARAKRRIITPSAPPAPPTRAPRTRLGPTAELFDPEGGLTEQGAKHVNRMARYLNRRLSIDEANLALSDPAVLEHVVKEHFRRINRGQGRVISGGSEAWNIWRYAKEILGDTESPVDLNQSTFEFLKRSENAALRQRLIDRLIRLRNELNIPEGELTDAQISQNSWEAAARLKARADAAEAPLGLRKAADEFVASMSRSIGDLRPDFTVQNTTAGTLTVVDVTHTVNTRFEVFHEFKTMLYARIFEAMTGQRVTGIEFRSPREQRVVTPP